MCFSCFIFHTFESFPILAKSGEVPKIVDIKIPTTFTNTNCWIKEKSLSVPPLMEIQCYEDPTYYPSEEVSENLQNLSVKTPPISLKEVPLIYFSKDSLFTAVNDLQGFVRSSPVPCCPCSSPVCESRTG